MSRSKWSSLGNREASYNFVGKDDKILKSEYKLLNYKEEKLRGGLNQQDRLINSQRDYLGKVLQGEVRPSGYYHKHLIRSNQRVANLHSSPSNKGLPSNPSGSVGLKRTHSPNGVQGLGGKHLDTYNLGGGPDISKPRVALAHQQSKTHPNSTEYVRRILSSKQKQREQLGDNIDSRQKTWLAYGKIHVSATERDDSRASSGAMRRVSLEGDSLEKIGEQGSSDYDHHEPQPRSLNNHYSSSNDPRKLKKTAHFGESDAIDLAHYITTQKASWSESGAQWSVNEEQQTAKNSHMMQTTQSIAQSAATFGSPPKYVHPKQTSYENALQLREGKIFAKINKELKIFDVRDLECSIGIDPKLLTQSSSKLVKL